MRLLFARMFLALRAMYTSLLPPPPPPPPPPPILPRGPHSLKTGPACRPPRGVGFCPRRWSLWRVHGALLVCTADIAGMGCGMVRPGPSRQPAVVARRRSVKAPRPTSAMSRGPLSRGASRRRCPNYHCPPTSLSYSSQHRYER